jgi:transposase
MSKWGKIEPFLPTDARGMARVDDRRVISGIVHVLKSGCRWCDCPPQYGPPTTIYNRFVRWAERGVWDKLFRRLAARGRSAETQMIDSAHVKAHRSASGGRGGRAKTGGWTLSLRAQYEDTRLCRYERPSCVHPPALFGLYDLPMR